MPPATPALGFGLFLGVRDADAMKIAQQFIAGNPDPAPGQSVKRTTEGSTVGMVLSAKTSAIRFTDWRQSALVPSNELLGYFQSGRFTDASVVPHLVGCGVYPVVSPASLRFGLVTRSRRNAASRSLPPYATPIDGQEKAKAQRQLRWLRASIRHFSQESGGQAGRHTQDQPLPTSHVPPWTSEM
jgi:hypothetical protein